MVSKQVQPKSLFWISKGILIRNMQLCAARTHNRLSTHAVQAARDQFKPSYTFLSRQKKTLSKKNLPETKKPIQDSNFEACNTQAHFPNIKAGDTVSLCVFTRVPSEETRFEPYKYGVIHPQRISYPSCYDTCKFHPCDNPYCKLTSVKVEGFDSHHGTEPLNDSGNPSYANSSKRERTGRFYHGRDLNNKKEFTCVYKNQAEIKPRTYDLAPNSGANADTSRTHYINEKIKQTRTNKPVIIEEIKKIDNDE